MSKKFKVKLITAEKPYFEGDCIELQVPAYDGMMGVMFDHAPFVTKLGTGVATVKIDDGNTLRFAMQNGFIQIVENDVTVLAERISTADEINSDKLSDRLSEFCEKIMKSASIDEHTKTELELSWLKSLKSLSQ
ncbi:MAG: ATP synthase F1 subunit epsilon [Planctomycetes bacterium]|nr:ATP synthase F1 subunit epsilon [Planctomycetota bacterium]